MGDRASRVHSSQSSHEGAESVGDVRMQGAPGGHGGSGLGIAHVVCAVDGQALQVATRLRCRGFVGREVMGCGERRKTEVRGNLGSAG